MTSATLTHESPATYDPRSRGQVLLGLSLLFAAVGLAAAAYGVAVTNPELAELERAGDTYLSMRYEVLMERTFYLAITAWGAGLAGVVLGATAAIRNRRGLGWAGAAAALAGAGLAFLLIH